MRYFTSFFHDRSPPKKLDKYFCKFISTVSKISKWKSPLLFLLFLLRHSPSSMFWCFYLFFLSLFFIAFYIFNVFLGCFLIIVVFYLFVLLLSFHFFFMFFLVFFLCRSLGFPSRPKTPKKNWREFHLGGPSPYGKAALAPCRQCIVSSCLSFLPFFFSFVLFVFLLGGWTN